MQVEAITDKGALYGAASVNEDGYAVFPEHQGDPVVIAATNLGDAVVSITVRKGMTLRIYPYWGN